MEKIYCYIKIHFLSLDKHKLIYQDKVEVKGGGLHPVLIDCSLLSIIVPGYITFLHPWTGTVLVLIQARQDGRR